MDVLYQIIGCYTTALDKYYTITGYAYTPAVSATLTRRLHRPAHSNETPWRKRKPEAKPGSVTICRTDVDYYKIDLSTGN